MIFLELFLTFFKIGLFSFGGGYAMIRLVQEEVVSKGWLTATEFVNMIAVAEMTPGPVAVNLATFSGNRAGGILGGIIATIGVSMPSFILVMIISGILIKYQNHPVKIMIFYGIRPVTIAMIIAAGVFVLPAAVLGIDPAAFTLSGLFNDPSETLNIGAVVILLASIAALLRFKLNPIIVLAASGVVGVLLFYVF